MALPPMTGSSNAGGLMFPGTGGAEPTKQFSSEECVQELIKVATTDPQVISNHIQIFNAELSTLYHTKLWPAVLDADAWERISTRRPETDEAGEKLIGSDRVVRTYENDIWLEHNRGLDAVVTSEHGSIIEVKFIVKW